MKWEDKCKSACSLMLGTTVASAIPEPDKHDQEDIDAAKAYLSETEELIDVVSGFEQATAGRHLLFGLTSRRLLVLRKKSPVTILGNLLFRLDDGS